MRVTYVDTNFGADRLAMIEEANAIIAEYQADGYELTLRQLYYQFVARDLIPNTVRSYKRLGSAINDGRLAGLIDWEAIEDRTRNLVAWQHERSVPHALQRLAQGFDLDRWQGQSYRVEVWVEKEALAGIFERVCSELDMPYFACRGYVSQSEMWRAARRLMRYRRAGQTPVILHFGDHDPSGIDMTRDIADRLDLFDDNTGLGIGVERLALNMDQVEQYAPPPNPAKLTDSRATGYIAAYGTSSWELDALDPRALAGLVRDAVEELLDRDLFDQRAREVEAARAELQAVSDRWDDVRAMMENGR